MKKIVKRFWNTICEIFRQYKKLFIFTILIGLLFTLGEDALFTLFFTIAYEIIFVKMHREQKYSRQKLLIEKKISNINNEIMKNNNFSENQLLIFNEHFYESHFKLISNIFEVFCYTCFNGPIIIYNIFEHILKKDNSNDNISTFNLLLSKVEIRVFLMLGLTLLCTIIISNLPECRRTNAISEKRSKEIKNVNNFGNIKNLQSYKSLTDFEKLFINDYDEKEFEILNN